MNDIDNLNKINSCKHYKRNCKIVSPCCNKVYFCRFCHDDDEYEDVSIDKLDNAHKLDRFTIKEVVCCGCDTRQPVSNTCNNCNITFADYYCEICNLFDNTDKKQFHCRKCGICRVNKDITYHCDGCNTCLIKTDGADNKHKCTSMKDKDCPVCLEDLFTSTKEVTSIQCGHRIHKGCLIEFCATSISCPLCKKLFVNKEEFNKAMEEYITRAVNPECFRNKKATILCNECLKKSTVDFHIAGHKCLECGSYNTDVINN